jgi:hypothetical protein
MNYRNVLLSRHRQVLPAPREPTALNHLAARNREALLAWRERLRSHGHLPTLTRL